ncbi:NAD(P)-dependent alcohol dehydrogenase [Kribbella italica]|uniref:NADPH:quinone reductase-like Zn-dependent oxidoreductase n=1 Tax=Kribbella italica TaxID=1540520 RepID=A0A7W9J3U0_9ACTN|nr:NAD(P)-dependent alcohol dehydrogenase [Kribbella italica]MBB5834640.1 NADPH:quinone reductase-like Zn-dependent oxidoreductase [Kribbella italica]
MKAIVQDRYGAPDVLELREIDQPAPGASDVLVRVHAAAVNARDWHLMRGDPYVARLMDKSTFGRRGPRQPVRGSDFAGVVESVGAGVTRFKPGDRVFGEADGAFAEFVCAPVTSVAHLPAALTFGQAAAFPLAANTALMGLRALEAGQHLLVNGASGGVGTFAVQIAKAYGAEVTAVCSTRNVDLVRELGADHVVDYTTTDFTRATAQYDVLLDLVGNRTLRDLRRPLKPGGTLVLSGGGVSRGGSLIGPVGLIIRGTLLAKLTRRHHIEVLEAVPRADNLRALADLAETGKVVAVVDREYPLAQAAEAIRYLEVDHARAKVVLTL